MAAGRVGGLPAVTVRVKDVIVIDGERHTVSAIERRDVGPTFVFTCDDGATLEVGAAGQVPVVWGLQDE